MMEERQPFDLLLAGHVVDDCVEKIAAPLWDPFAPYLVLSAINDNTLLPRILSLLRELRSVQTAWECLRNCSRSALLRQLMPCAKSMDESNEGNSSSGGSSKRCSEFESASDSVRMCMVARELFFALSQRLSETKILSSELYVPEVTVLMPCAVLLLSSAVSISKLTAALSSLPANNARAYIIALLFNVPHGFDLAFDSLVRECGRETLSIDIVAQIVSDVSDASPHAAVRMQSLLTKAAHRYGRSPLVDDAQALRRVYMIVDVLAQKMDLDNNLYVPKTPVTLHHRPFFSKLGDIANNETSSKVAAMELCGWLTTCITTFREDLQETEINSVCEAVERYIRFPRVVELGLCFLISCKELLKRWNEESAIRTLVLLRDSGLSEELFVLMAIHFHAGDNSAVAELVRSSVDASLSIHTQSLVEIGKLIMHKVLPEQQVAERILQLPIEVNLSSDSKGRAVACVYHLLRGKIFRRHGVDITNWILQQLRAATLPVNPLLPALIEEFVDAIVGSATTTDDAEGNGSVPFKMKRFEEADIRAVMNPSPPFVFNAPAVLMLYYLSSFEKRLTIASSSTNGKQTPAIPTGIKKVLQYSNSLYDDLPIQFWLSQVFVHKPFLKFVYAPLISMMVVQYPQFYQQRQLLPHLLLKPSRKREDYKVLDKISLLVDKIEGTKTPRSCLVLVRSFFQCSSTSMHCYIPVSFWNRVICALISHFIRVKMGADKEDVFNRTSEEQGETVDEQCCSALSSALLDLWKCISTTQSWDVGLTIVRLLSHNGGAEVDFTLSSLSFAASARFLRLAKDSRSHSDMVVDPLLVLRVRKEVLTHPPLIRIILDILKGYMVASRSHLYEKAQANRRESFPQEELNTLIFAQDSAILQILLEIMSSVSTECEGRKLEVQQHICDFIHEQFLEQPLLCKLLHFQTYDRSLLPITVRMIPSMHLCLDFLPDLLHQPDENAQVFGVWLAVALFEQYPIPKSVEIGREVLQLLRVAASVTQGIEFLRRTVMALVDLCDHCPLLIPDACQLLVGLQPPRGTHETHVSRCAHDVRQDEVIQAISQNAFDQIIDLVLMNAS